MDDDRRFVELENPSTTIFPFNTLFAYSPHHARPSSDTLPARIRPRITPPRRIRQTLAHASLPKFLRNNPRRRQASPRMSHPQSRSFVPFLRGLLRRRKRTSGSDAHPSGHAHPHPRWLGRRGTERGFMLGGGLGDVGHGVVCCRVCEGAAVHGW